MIRCPMPCRVTLRGATVQLRPTTAADAPILTTIRRHPEVARWWGGGGPDLAAEVTADLLDPETHTYVVLTDRVIGMIQWHEEDDPMYRHAGIDIFLAPTFRGRGLGADAVHTLAGHLTTAHGHHRLVIDPAAANTAAIRCYEKVGFRRVGVLRRYERTPTGDWRDGLLMDLLADELHDPAKQPGPPGR